MGGRGGQAPYEQEHAPGIGPHICWGPHFEKYAQLTNRLIVRCAVYNTRKAPSAKVTAAIV